MTIKKIAVAGTGAIGAMVGGWLTRAGFDVTLLSTARPEQALLLNQTGLTLEGYKDTFHVPVQAKYLYKLDPSDRYNAIFLTMKSNGLVDALPELCRHLATDGVIIPMQNGINDKLLESYTTPEHIVTCVTFAGGAQLGPGRYMNHDGEFWVGASEAVSKEVVQNVVELAEKVRPTHLTEKIREIQWDKLSRVCLSVPTACISGLYLGDVFCHPDTQKLFAALALEIFHVARADGCPREVVEERTESEWEKIFTGRLTGLEHANEFKPWPKGIVDAYTADIRKGLPLEIDYTNGAVVHIGEQYGIDTPAHREVLRAVHEIERGERKAGKNLLQNVYQEIEQAIKKG